MLHKYVSKNRITCVGLLGVFPHTHRDNSDKSTVNLTVIIDEALDKYENKKKKSSEAAIMVKTEVNN